MIKTLELDQLCNIKNAILYSLFYYLIFGIKYYLNEGPDNNSKGNITILWAMLIYLADKKVVYGFYYWLS